MQTCKVGFSVKSTLREIRRKTFTKLKKDAMSNMQKWVVESTINAQNVNRKTINLNEFLY